MSCRYWYQTRYVARETETMILFYRNMKEDPMREYSRVLEYMGIKVAPRPQIPLPLPHQFHTIPRPPLC